MLKLQLKLQILCCKQLSNYGYELWILQCCSIVDCKWLFHSSLEFQILQFCFVVDFKQLFHSSYELWILQCCYVVDCKELLHSSCDLYNLQCCFVVDCKQLFSILVGSFRNNTACPLPFVILNCFKGFQSCKLATSKMFVTDLVADVVATLCHSILVLHASCFCIQAPCNNCNQKDTLVIDFCALFASVCCSSFLWISRNHFCLSPISM